MKSINILACCLPLLLSAIVRQQTPFKELQPLAGTWKSEKGARTIYESWSLTKTGEMHGKSYRLQEKDTTVFENVKLSEEKDGIYYTPTVKNENGGQPVPFKLTASANRQFVFENAAHDFPQRIIYNLIGQDSLHAWIEGKQNGKNARIDYYYKRMN